MLKAGCNMESTHPLYRTAPNILKLRRGDVRVSRKQCQHSWTGRAVRAPADWLPRIHPAPLPPEPPLRLTGELQSLLSDADRALGRLDGSIQTLPDPDLFVFHVRTQRSRTLSQIEGTQSSLQDVLAAEAKILSPSRPRDAQEVINYVAAMNTGLERLGALPVSIRLIRDIHKILLARVRGSHLTPGELRTSQNWIGPEGCTLDQAEFVPPPPHEALRVLGELETFIHKQDDLPILVRLGLVHAQFETIHPFLDGNGRMGDSLSHSC